MKQKKGVSLLEILVVLAIFSILAVLATRAVLLTLRGSRKSDALARVRENVEFSMAIIERQLRNAESVEPCPNPDTSTISFRDKDGGLTSFSCVDIGTDGYVASASSRMTSDEVQVTSCSFTCDIGVSGVPPSVAITVEAQDKDAQGAESAKVTSTTRVFLRTY